MIVKDSPMRVILMPAAPKANATYWVCQLKPGHCLQSECYGIEASCAINCKNQLEFSILRPQDFGEDGIGSRTPTPFFDYRFTDFFSGICILQRQHHLDSGHQSYKNCSPAFLNSPPWRQMNCTSHLRPLFLWSKSLLDVCKVIIATYNQFGTFYKFTMSRTGIHRAIANHYNTIILLKFLEHRPSTLAENLLNSQSFIINYLWQ